jgi:hypothetical protein
MSKQSRKFNCRFETGPISGSVEGRRGETPLGTSRAIVVHIQEQGLCSPVVFLAPPGPLGWALLSQMTLLHCIRSVQYV